MKILITEKYKALSDTTVKSNQALYRWLRLTMLGFSRVSVNNVGYNIAFDLEVGYCKGILQDLIFLLILTEKG
jgi:hypothetical protein